MPLTLNWKLVQSFLGEIAASFMFGFAVYSAIISSALTDQEAGPIVVGLAVGLSGVATIYTFVDITLAHFNPAITLAAIIFGKLGIFKGIIYMICQCLGFMIACACCLGCYPASTKDLLDLMRPKRADSDVTVGNLILTEMLLTGILTFVAFSVAINAFKKSKRVSSQSESALPRGTADFTDIEESVPDRSILAPLCIGFTLGFLALLGFSSSGGAFNPGIVLAPVLFSGKWKDSWAYWVSEFTGGFGGALIQVFILARSY